MVRDHIERKIYHIEVLTPKQNTEDLDKSIERFTDKYTKVIDAGYVVSIPDNPLGNVHFQAIEMLTELDLPIVPGQLIVHLNTFHTRDDVDRMAREAIDLGLRQLLIISGDGSERLPKLKPEAIGFSVESVTSVELLQYLHREYPDTFHCGVAFNPYEPQDHELDKMSRKIDAGAEFIVTQPILGKDDRIDALEKYDVPVILGAWMSKKVHLLSECVGYDISPDTEYDPIANLRKTHELYPKHGLYLAMLGFKTQYPLLKEIWI